MMKLSVFSFLIVIGFITGQEHDQSKEQLVIRAVGPTDFSLGALYDARKDQIISGRYLWKNEDVKRNTIRVISSSVKYDIVVDTSYEQRAKSLDITADLALSMMGGLIHVEGSAKYLSESSSSSKQATASLLYFRQDWYDSFDVSELNRSASYSAVIEDGLATHVVTGITFGGRLMINFQSSASDSSKTDEVSGTLKLSIQKALPIDLHGSGSVNISSDEKQFRDGTKVSVSNDFHRDSEVPPLTFQEAIDYYNSTCRCSQNDCPGIPLTIRLYPLALLDDRASAMKWRIAETMSTTLLDRLQDIDRFSSYTNDLIELTKKSFLFDSIGASADAFRKAIFYMREIFVTRLYDLLPDVRAGKVDVQALKDLDQVTVNTLDASKFQIWAQDRISMTTRIIEAINGLKLYSMDNLPIETKTWVFLKFTLKDSFVMNSVSLLKRFSPTGSNTSFPQDLEPWLWKSYTTSFKTARASSIFLNLITANQDNPNKIGFNVFFDDNSQDTSEFASIRSFDPETGIFNPSPFAFAKAESISLNVQGNSGKITWKVDGPVADISGYRIYITNPNYWEEIASRDKMTYEFVVSEKKHSTFQICVLIANVCGPLSDSMKFQVGDRQSMKYDTLKMGIDFYEGDEISSMIDVRTSYQFKAVLRNGALVIDQYFNGKSLGERWHGDSYYEGTSYSMQLTLNGELKISKTSGELLWTSNSAGASTEGPFTLKMKTDGNLVIEDRGGNIIWASNTVSSSFNLFSGESLCSSPSSFTKITELKYESLSMRIGSDGRLALFAIQPSYGVEGTLWKSSVDVQGECLKLERDGTLRIYRNDFSKSIAGPFNVKDGPFSLMIQKEVMLGIYDYSGKVVWKAFPEGRYETKNNLPQGWRLCAGDALFDGNFKAKMGQGTLFLSGNGAVESSLGILEGDDHKDNCFVVTSTGYEYIKRQSGEVLGVYAPLDDSLGPYSFTVEDGKGFYFRNYDNTDLKLVFPHSENYATACRPGNDKWIDYLANHDVSCTEPRNSYLSRFRIKTDDCAYNNYHFEYSCLEYSQTKNVELLLLPFETPCATIRDLPYFDQFTVKCPQGSALASIEAIVHPPVCPDRMLYQYTCTPLPSKSVCNQLQTECHRVQDLPLYYLIEYDVNCEGNAMSGFHMNGEGCTDGKRRITYECCRF